ncbi:D-alanine--poly(phosphoribitol) ligase [Paenibacillus elgii]|uniref:D-alanine--D-alanyl carrier protein ligase n=1 Tax=Paenibacillus elgii TaxID=189691 RepID=A0A163USG0_9BACL|nr:D-alanine--poly(phosphoribitol) ligase subunit DltA [Paenibacillus elgii]KZE73771.1 D-alanine--poly(phosphoribitol) ligase [Paenibacillus elgii]
MTILDRIERKALQDPQHTAFIRGEERLAYGQLWNQSDALARWIVDTIGADNRPVLVYGHMEPEMLVCFLACVKAGHAYIPVDSSVPEARLASIVRGSQPPLVLAPGLLPPIETGSAVVAGRSDRYPWRLEAIFAEYAGLHPDPECRVEGGENFYIIYTSGSTGEPKGVQITLDCLESFVRWTQEEFALRDGDVFLNQAPFSFDLSVMDLYPCLTGGGTLWALDREWVASPAVLFERLAKSGIAVWTSTPSFAEFCLMDKSFSQELLPDLHTFLFCGEILSRRCVQKLKERFPKADVYNTYGPTEATVAVTSLRTDEHMLAEYPALPVGYCKPDCRIRIMDEAGQPLPDGEKGEIWIVGPSVGPGYFQRPELSERCFLQVNDPELGLSQAYRTGDSGFLRSGLLFFGGRIDFQVKLHGYRIELGDIEHQLLRLPGIKNAVVLPHYREDKCDYLAAFLVPEQHPDDEFALAQSIRKELASSLPDYMIPKKIVFKTSLPMNINGKADRKPLLSEV